MPKVLLLTAGYGEGHNAAARGLHAALTESGADAEIVDLFALTGGAFYEKTRRAYVELINRAPKIWAAAYNLIDLVPMGALSMPFLGGMRQALAELIAEKKPSAIVSVYPVYGYVVDELYPNPRTRPFAFHTVVTDSITINSIWHRCPSDTFLVPNNETAAVMIRAGVPEKHLRVLGFPVSPRFARERPQRPEPQPPRVLYMINAGQDQAPGIVARLLRIKSLHLTVTVGRDEALRARIEEIAELAGRPVEIHGWTPHMPELLMTHHLLIGKAGGATVQECIAARTPMLMTQVVPGQEEGNAQLLFQNSCGALCPTAEALAEKIEELFARDAAEWLTWEKNIGWLSRPDAALQIARFILGDESQGKVEPGKFPAAQSEENEEPATPEPGEGSRSPEAAATGHQEKTRNEPEKAKSPAAPGKGKSAGRGGEKAEGSKVKAPVASSTAPPARKAEPAKKEKGPSPKKKAKAPAPAGRKAKGKR